MEDKMYLAKASTESEDMAKVADSLLEAGKS